MVRRSRALRTLVSILILSLVLSLWLAWKAGTQTREAKARDAEIEFAFKLLAADAGKAARSRDPKAGWSVGHTTLVPSAAEDWDDDKFDAVRTRAVEAIEAFLDTSRIEEDAFVDDRAAIWRTGKAALAYDPAKSSLLIMDSQENVERVFTFLNSLGFRAPAFPTSTPTPGPRLRPIS